MDTNSDNKLFTIFPKAEKYIQDLLEKRKSKQGVCLFVEQPGTPNAETCLCYFEDIDDTDVHIYTQYNYNKFSVFVREDYEKYIQDAQIDLAEDDFGAQLTIKSPNSKVKKLDANASVTEQIKYIIDWEINPSLASHGGFVSLLGLEDDDTTAILEFGGGCQGCSMIDVTLKSGVEKNLLEKIPSLKKIKDSTDHSETEQAYY